MTDEIKSCRLCGVLKPLAEFYKETTAQDGRRGECIECAQGLRRKWYEKNRERSIANVKAWQAAAQRHAGAEAEDAGPVLPADVWDLC